LNKFGTEWGGLRANKCQCKYFLHFMPNKCRSAGCTGSKQKALLKSTFELAGHVGLFSELGGLHHLQWYMTSCKNHFGYHHSHYNFLGEIGQRLDATYFPGAFGDTTDVFKWAFTWCIRICYSVCYQLIVDIVIDNFWMHSGTL